MTNHNNKIKNIVYQPIDQLIKQLRLKQNISMNGIEGQLIDIRESEMRTRGKKYLIKRAFVATTESGVFMNVGWVINNDIEICLICKHFFNFFRWKHHCRACGMLACGFCTYYFSVIMTMEDIGAVRVCVDCFRGPVCFFSEIN
jgi:hypothetical protein